MICCRLVYTSLSFSIGIDAMPDSSGVMHSGWYLKSIDLELRFTNVKFQSIIHFNVRNCTFVSTIIQGKTLAYIVIPSQLQKYLEG